MYRERRFLYKHYTVAANPCLIFSLIVGIASLRSRIGLSSSASRRSSS